MKRYFKDHIYSSYILVTKETDDLIYGIQYIGDYISKLDNFTKLDNSSNIWIKSLHEWEEITTENNNER